MSWTRRREIVVVIAVFCVSAILVDAFLIVPTGFKRMVVELQKYTIIIQATALGLMFTSLLSYHGRHVMRRTPDQWYMSAWLIFLMVLVSILGLIPPITKNLWYNRFFSWIYVPSNIALYGIMACFIASATYRAFRASTYDGAACLIAATLVLVGMNTPLGALISPALPEVASWLVVVPQMGGGRALIFLTAIGMLGLTLRLITGKIREVI